MKEAVAAWLPHDPETRLLCAFLPQHTARQWLLQRALESELLGILLAAREPDVVRSKLAWWQGEFLCMAEGRATHPLTRDLVTLGWRAAGVPWAAASQTLAGEMDASPPTDLDELLRRCEPLGQALCCISGSANQPVCAPVLGTLPAIIHLRERLLRAQGFTASEIALLPVNWLARYQVRSTDIATAKPPAQVRKLIGDLGALLLQRLQSAGHGIDSAADHVSLPVYLQALLTRQWLHGMKDRGRITPPAGHGLWPWRQCWQLWRGARRYRLLTHGQETERWITK